jgi:DNA-binding GntR family transcriptional regulator
MMPASEAVLFTFRDNGTSGTERQSDEALDHLRTMIITMDLEPGSLINELTLSQRLGYGRTPLREAVYRLAEEHLVVILPHRSVAVAPMSISDLQQIFEARTYLEGAAVRLATERITPAQLAAIEEREREIETLAERSDFSTFCRWAAQHFEFHCLLAQACGNEYLNDSIRRVLPASMRLDFFLYRRGAKGRDRAKNHLQTLEAMKAGDADAAERLHIAGSKERVLRLL